MSTTERHILRGGLDEVVLYTEAGDVHSVGSRLRGARAERAPTEDVERFEAGDGTERDRARTWTWEPVLVGEADLRVVRAWRDAGKRIGVIGLGPEAVLWRELVPILLRDAGGARGQLGGGRLRLVTRLLDAEVARSPDLLAGVEGEATGDGTRWRAALPLEGRLVRIEAAEAGEMTVRLYDATGTMLAEQTAAGASVGDDIYVSLAEETYDIEVEAPNGARPPVCLLEVTLVLILVSEEANSATVRLVGGEATPSTIQITNPLTGEVEIHDTFTLPERPAGLVAGETDLTATLRLKD